MRSASGFYHSVPRNNPPSINSGSNLLEKKLDKILDKVTEQGNQMVILKEKGEKTLDSLTSLEKKLSTLEDKVNFIEQSSAQSQEKKETKCQLQVPPELSVIFNLFVII